jgi:alpha-beta hydrolase superfamily lysophospholipase
VIALPNQAVTGQSGSNDISGTFLGARDVSLFYRAWYPSEPAKAVVALVHGLGEHCDRYSTIVSALTRSGYALYGFDNQGHGRSGGQRGHIERWQDYRENTQRFVELIRQHEPTLPLFILGHSLGGLIVLDYGLHAPDGLQGVIISGPPIHPVGVAKPYLVIIARLLSGLLPRLALKIGLGPEALTRDPAIAEATRTDPMVSSVATLRWGMETMVAIATVRQTIRQWQLPILLIHGSADTINAVTGSQELFNNITHPDKTLKIYPDNYHEPHNDLDREKVVADLVEWLDKHL